MKSLQVYHEMLETANRQLEENQLEEALDNATKVFEQCQNGRTAQMRLRAGNLLGKIHLERNDLKQAEHHASEIVTSDKSLERGKALVLLATIRHREGNFEEAITNAKAALETDVNEAEEEKLVLYRVLAECFYQNGDINDALNYYLLLSETARRCGEKRKEYTAIMRVAHIHSVQGEFKTALNRIFEALSIAEDNGFNDLIARCYNNIGNIYIRIQNYEEVME